MMRRRTLLMGLPGVGLGGCSSPDPRLYVLQPVSGATRTGAPRLIVLRDVTLARYLERPQIVRSAGGYQLDVESNDWWGEPLGAMVGRVLARDLAARLPGSQVLASNGAITAPADATVEVNLLRLDGEAGQVRLQAQVAVLVGEGTAARTTMVDTTAPEAGGSVADHVAASSVALGTLADAVAAALSGVQSRV